MSGYKKGDMVRHKDGWLQAVTNRVRSLDFGHIAEGGIYEGLRKQKSCQCD